MSIASRIQEIETHIGDVYDTINYSYDTTGINKNIINIPKYLRKGYIDIINNGIDTLYNNFPKVSGIGSNLSLTPTYEAPMKLNEIQGSTLQYGTPTPDTPVPIQSVTGLQNVNVCGKNLITTYNYASSGYINYNYDNSKIGKTMTYSFIPNFSTTNASLYIRANTSISSYKVGTIATITSGTKVSVTFTLTDEQYNTIKNTTGGYIQVYKSGVSMDENSISNPMLEINNQATEYEPYKGNTYEVNLGKNLFDKDNANILNAYINSNNNSSDYKKIISNNNSRTIYISCKSNTTYTVSKIAGQRFVVASCNNVPEANVLCTNEVHDQTGVSLTITTGANDKYLVVFYYLSTADTSTEEQIRNSIQIEVGTQATSYSPYFTPIELNKIGDYQDSIKKSTGKNLFDEEYELGTINYNTGELEDSTTIIRTKNYQTIKPSTSYTLKVPDEVNGIILYYYNNGTYVATTQPTVPSTKVITFTTNANANQVKWRFNSNYTTLNNQTMLNEGSTALPYEPYGKVWYVKKQISKVVLNGSEKWFDWSNNRMVLATLTDYKKVDSSTTSLLMSNYYKAVSRANSQTNNSMCFYGNSDDSFGIIVCDGTNNTSTLLKAWLSTHNTEVLYVLATPEYTEITNTELIKDLETLYTAKSQEGTTNISITSEDLEMILNVSALKGDA